MNNRVEEAITQISAVPVTPYDTDGEISVARLHAVVSAIVASGVRNVVAAGNTGEFFSLTTEEVARLHVEVVAACDRHCVVTAAVGRALKEAKAQAIAAARAGADLVMIHQPQDPFTAASGQAAYFLDIAEESPIPVVIYIRADNIGIDQLARVVAHENIIGVKFACGNIPMLARLVKNHHEHAAWICGLAESWAPSFYAVGARGFTSGIVNIYPQLSLALYARLEAGDYAAARAVTGLISEFEEMRARNASGGNVTVVKSALASIGVAVGPVRPPGLQVLSPAEIMELGHILASMERRIGDADWLTNNTAEA